MVPNLPYLNYHDSIEKRKLIYKRNLADVFRFITIPVTGIGLMLFLVINKFDITNQNDRAIVYVIFPPVFLFCCYLIYRKLTELKLTGIKTNLSKKRNKELLNQFLESENYIINTHSEDILFLLEEDIPTVENHRICVTIFLISDNEIFFNMGKYYSGSNWPILIDHFFMQRDLKRFFSDKYK